MSLESRLASLRAEIARRTPDHWSRNQRQIAELAASGVADSALRAGEPAPDFSLAATTGEIVSLDSLLAGGPAVVSFFRGGWCRFCQAGLTALDEIRSRLAGRGVALAGIGPEPQGRAADLALRLALGFPLLSDHELAVARLFGITHDLRPDVADALEQAGVDRSCLVGAWGPRLPLPATYVIGRDGVVAWAFVDPDFTRRAEPLEVLAAAKRLKAENPARLNAAR